MKKAEQLGMNPSTARNRLLKSIVFQFIELSGQMCFRCDQVMSRDDFSIDHIEPWLDSEDPLKLYFDLENVTFSHHTCNSGAARHSHQKYFTVADKQAGRLQKQREWRQKNYTPEKRRERYLRTGN